MEGLAAEGSAVEGSAGWAGTAAEGSAVDQERRKCKQYSNKTRYCHTKIYLLHPPIPGSMAINVVPKT